jgi:membrane protein DedA with SNARE-associated domain
METLQHFFMQHSGVEAYLIFFMIVTASCVGLFNSDIAFITSGALSAVGFFDYRLLIILGFIGLLSGDSITYFSGRKWGRTIIRKKPFSFVLNDAKLDVAEGFFKRKGLFFVFLVRFLPLLRTSLFLTIGSLRVHPKHFYSLNAFSTAIYLPLVIIGSNRASANAGEIVATLKRFQFVPLTLLVGLIVFFVVKKNGNKKLNKVHQE